MINQISSYGKVLLTGASTLMAICGSSASVKAADAVIKDKKQPNLLFIFADQYRRASLGFLNEDPVNTPNIDRLAAEGVFFSQAVSNHPLSSPFRGMLLTGKYPLSSGVITNCNSLPSRATNELRKEDVCFTDVLANNGYNVGYVGKWHLDAPSTTAKGEEVVWDSWCPPERRHGVDFWYSYGTDNEHMRPHYWANDTPADKPFYVDQWSPEHEADVIIGYLKDSQKECRDTDKPFAMFWGINPPHSPFKQVPQRYVDMFAGKTAKDVLNRPNVSFSNNAELPVGDKMVTKTIDEAPYYFAMVNGVDEQIGRVLAALKEAGLDDNTIVIFTSDHGEMLGSQGLMHKNVWFQESYSIPMIVHWPASVKPKTDDLLISVPDYMPTVLGLMGLGAHIPEGVEGHDYSGVFYDKKIDRPDYQLYFGTEPSAINYGKRGVKTATHTFAVYKSKKGEKSYYLYDNVKDPFQMANIWGQNPEFDMKMESKLNDVLAGMNDPWIK